MLEALVLAAIITYAIKKAAGDASAHWQSSKAANRRGTRGQTVRRRAASALQHDAGYWGHQAVHGFPQARHGLATGWHAGRTAQAQGAAARQQARTEHLEQRARLIPEIREHRRRQQEALDRIRAAQQPEPEPEPDPEPQPGCTYSWGRADHHFHSPAASLAEAVEKARHYAQYGTPYVVCEYPPRGGPGRVIATYGSPVPLARDYLTQADAIRDSLEHDGCPLCAGGREVHDIRPDARGNAHAWCDPPEEDAAEDDSGGDHLRWPQEPSTEGHTAMPTAPGETTYNQQLGELNGIRQDAEAAVSDARVKRMVNRLDTLAGLGLDSASLSEAAAIDDALQAQQRAAQQLLDATDAAIHGLTTRHGGIQEAVDNAPIAQPAQPEFYAG